MKNFFLLLALLACLLAGTLSGRAQADSVIADFTGGIPATWKSEGAAFGKPSTAKRLFLGWLEFYSVLQPTNGLLTSPRFTLAEPYLNLRVRAGEKLRGIAQLILVDSGTSGRDAVIRVSPQAAVQTGDAITWDVRDYLGTNVYIQLADLPSAASVNLQQVTATQSPLEDLGWQAQVRPAFDMVESKRAAVAQDPFRPVYHTAAPAGKSWDMNGCFYSGGYYHTFYLTAPPGLNAYQSHLRSRDLIHWDQLAPALWPSVAIGENDIYSGDGILGPDGKGYLFYTSVGIDRTPLFTPRIGLAVSLDSNFVSWRKEDRPILTTLDIPVEARHVRDPFVFKEGDQYYLAITGQILKDKYKTAFARAPIWPAEVTMGCFFLFSSADLRQWKYLGMPLTAADVQLWNGPLWEMAMLLKFGDKWLFTAGGKAYYTGTLDLANAQFTVEQQGTITCGTFYAARRVIDPQGRCLVWAPATCGFRGANYVLGANSWESVYCLPRIWSLDEAGRLKQEVAPELQALRGQHASRRDLAINNTLVKIDESTSHCLEVQAELELGNAQKCGLELRRSADGASGMRVSFDGNQVVVESIGPDILIGPNKIQEWWALKNVIPLQQPTSGKVKLHVFLDRGLLEVFVNDQITFERSIEHLPLQNAGVACFASGGTATVRALDLWTINPISVKYYPFGLIDSAKSVSQSTWIDTPRL